MWVKYHPVSSQSTVYKLLVTSHVVFIPASIVNLLS